MIGSAAGQQGKIKFSYQHRECPPKVVGSKELGSGCGSGRQR